MNLKLLTSKGDAFVPFSRPTPCKGLSPVVQSIISSFRGQLSKYFTTLQPNTLKFFVKKMGEAFALQKLLTFFQQKILAYLRN